MAGQEYQAGLYPSSSLEAPEIRRVSIPPPPGASAYPGAVWAAPTPAETPHLLPIWIGATIGALIVGWLAGTLVSRNLLPATNGFISQGIMNSAIFGLCLGIALGVGQWLAIRRTLPLTVPLIVGSAIGWPAANALDASMLALFGGPGTNYLVAQSFNDALCGLIIGTIQALLAGRVLPYRGRHLAAYSFGLMLTTLTSGLVGATGVYLYLFDLSPYLASLVAGLVNGTVLGVVTGVVMLEQVRPATQGGQPVADWEVASKGTRFGNHVVDTVVTLVINLGASVLLQSSLFQTSSYSSGFSRYTTQALTYVIALLLYVVFEATLGRTPGKMVTGTVVVTETGGRPTFGAILARTLSRLVPFEAFSTFSGIPWHDRWSGTRVVSNSKRSW